MKLESKYDFRELRKAQSKVTQKYNRAAKSIEKLELGEEINKQFEAILTQAFDKELQKVTADVQAKPGASESFV